MNDVPDPSSDTDPDGEETGRDKLAAAIEAYREPIRSLKMEVGRIFIGPDEIIESLLIATIARGHILLEGVPGVAKTTLVRAFARTLAADFRRIQFTPDLLPSDITGTYVPNLQTNEFVLRKGPVFTNVLLGDEINRAPAKTQSALLEAMQERQVTIEGVTHDLEEPFLVLATQNPVEQEGVYSLPEAQLDRFLMKIEIGYPDADGELEVLETHQRTPDPAESILGDEDIDRLRRLAERIYISQELQQYVIDLVRFTRRHADTELGASPRASLALVRASKARALVRGRDYVLPDDIQALAESTLAHRLVLQPEAELGGAEPSHVVEQALDSVEYAES
jgi:MoxR-like ATPase